MTPAPTLARTIDDLKTKEASTFRPPSTPFTPLLSPRRLTRPLPALDVRERSSFAPGWHVDSFLAPAAFPRTQRNGTRRRGEPSSVAHRPARGTKEDHIDYEKLLEDVVGAQIETVPNPLLDVEGERRAVDEQEQLYLAVNRYTPSKPRPEGTKGVTVVFCHGTGLCKELWEPVIRAAVEELEREGDVRVDEVFALDTVNQGDSAIVNEDVLGKGSNWADLARDLLNFLICYVDSPTFTDSPSSSTTVLRPSSFDPAEFLLDSKSPPPPGAALPAYRASRSGKTIVGIGHSLGASACALAATAAPYLFSSLLLFDPWLMVDDYSMTTVDSPYFRSIALRRDSWNSREEAVSSMREKGFFKGLDKEVVELFMHYGVRDLRDGRVGTKTSSAIERVLFANPLSWQGPYLFRRLRALDPSLPLHFFLPAKHRSIVPDDQLVKVIDGLQWATLERIEKSQHNEPLIHPHRTGEAIAKKLRETYGREAPSRPRL